MRHPALRRSSFVKDTEVIWHGVEPNKPDFSHHSRTLALALDGRLTGREPDHDIYMAFNAWKEALPFVIPTSPQGKRWRRVINTAMAPPLDITPLEEGME